MVALMPILLGGAMIATVLVLFTGIITFAFDSSLNKRYATQIMTIRVVLQGIAVVLFALIVVINVA